MLEEHFPVMARYKGYLRLVVQDASDDRVFTFVEKYLDEAAVEAHTNSEHFQTYVPMMSAFREGPSEVAKCVTVDF
jgi:quinol monooxygenase YgiN